MARTKMVVRMVADQRRQQIQQLGPSRAAPRRRRAPWTGVKNIEGSVRNKTFKIKKLIAVTKNIEIKKRANSLKNGST